MIFAFLHFDTLLNDYLSDLRVFAENVQFAVVAALLPADN